MAIPHIAVLATALTFLAAAGRDVTDAVTILDGEGEGGGIAEEASGLHC